MKPLCWHCDKPGTFGQWEAIRRGPFAGYRIRRCGNCQKITEIQRDPDTEAFHLRLTRTTTKTPLGEVTTIRGQRIIGYILKRGTIPKGVV